MLSYDAEILVTDTALPELIIHMDTFSKALILTDLSSAIQEVIGN